MIALEIKQMNAREQIVRVLEEIFEHGAYSNIALNQALEQSLFSDKDKSFVTEVVYGSCLRYSSTENNARMVSCPRDRGSNKVGSVALLSFDDESLSTCLFGPYSRPCCCQ